MQMGQCLSNLQLELELGFGPKEAVLGEQSKVAQIVTNSTQHIQLKLNAGFDMNYQKEGYKYSVISNKLSTNDLKRPKVHSKPLEES